LATFDRKNGIRTEFNIPMKYSWGSTYRLVTEKLGFKGHSGEGKTMGLACYGKPDENLVPKPTESLGLPKEIEYQKLLGRKCFSNLKGNPDCKTSTTLAASIQHYYEKSLVKMGESLSSNGCKNFALAGGVALNCTGNGTLSRQNFVENIFIQPSSHDAGTALGAAILAHKDKTGKWPNCKFNNAYWGPSFKDKEILEILNFLEITNYKKVDPVGYGSMLLKGDMIIGWFQGASEVGPWALGNRSILANPMNLKNLDRVNKIKGREHWRPLAPSILEEDYFDIVDSSHKSPFMLMA